MNFLNIKEFAFLTNKTSNLIKVWIKEEVLDFKYKNREFLIPANEIIKVQNIKSLLSDREYSVNQVCKLLDLGNVESFRGNYIRTGRVKYKRIKGKIYITGKDLEEFLIKEYKRSLG